MTSQPAALDRWIGFSPTRPAVRRNRMHFTPAGYARLSDKQRARVEEALCRGDLYGEVGGAWAVKEQLRWHTTPTLPRWPATASTPSTGWRAPPALQRSSDWPPPSNDGSPRCSPSSPRVARTPG